MSKASMNKLVAFLALAGSAVAACAALAGAAQAAEAEAAAPPIGSFFRSANFSGAALAPNGRHLAIRIANGESRANLAVLDLATMKLTQVAGFGDADIGRFEWVNDERLVYNMTDLRLARGEMVEGPGLYAVNRDGRGERQLVDRSYSAITSGTDIVRLDPNTHLVGPGRRQDGNEVFVVRAESYEGKDAGHFLFQRLNTKNSAVVALDTPEKTIDALIDAQGAVRVAVTRDRDRQALLFNDPASGKWRTLAQFNSNGEGAVQPLLYGPDNVLYVAANNGRDKTAIYRYDLAAGKLEAAPLVASDQYDIDGEFIVDAAKVLGFRYEIDAEVTTWFDPAMQAAQTAVDALLGATTNRISRGARSETPFFLVESFSDVQPHVYQLFNSATGKLTRLGGANADIDPRRMSIKDMVRYKARDGLEIPAYLTLPAGGPKTNLPMVVLVHGGPYLRGGSWEFDPEVQFLASRGYAVLQPEFRGSTGFGTRHFRAGWKQWGQAMQNDIADGAKWAIAQGHADPKRICIAGASYGGYAALMGLIKDPELFKCGINWIGVTDIGLLYTVRWSDLGDNWKKYGMPQLVGDPVKDAAMFELNSPLRQAARLRQPLLMAYGGADERVPLVHGTRFHDAVKAVNPSVEWVVYGQEGHGWRLQKTRVDFWGRVERFLERNIGKP
ncbi:MAG: alpha/beta fold hydrolase [Pseudomonadota bacterium]